MMTEIYPILVQGVFLLTKLSQKLRAWIGNCNTYDNMSVITFQYRNITTGLLSFFSKRGGKLIPKALTKSVICASLNGTWGTWVHTQRVYDAVMLFTTHSARPNKACAVDLYSRATYRNNSVWVEWWCNNEAFVELASCIYIINQTDNKLNYCASFPIESVHVYYPATATSISLVVSRDDAVWWLCTNVEWHQRSKGLHCRLGPWRSPT